MEIPFINRDIPAMDRLYLEDIEIPYLKERQKTALLLAEIARAKHGYVQPRTKEVKFWGKVKIWFTKMEA